VRVGGGGGLAPVALVPPVPPLEVFFLDLFERDGDAEAQLDYMAQFRPVGMSTGDWDRGVSQVGVVCGLVLGLGSFAVIEVQLLMC